MDINTLNFEEIEFKTTTTTTTTLLRLFNKNMVADNRPHIIEENNLADHTIEKKEMEV